MATTTVIVIAFLVLAAILTAVALGFVIVGKRKQHGRIEAGTIRADAAEESHIVGQRESLADETAARARVAQAEADVKVAHAAGLQHQADARRSDAVHARDEVNRQYMRADTVDPDVHTPDAENPDETPRGEGETGAAPNPRPIGGVR
ncbi:hypothetical protein [Mycolicibacterium sphagni]|uniref:hypothetical protein n=1 Tax=Mycolicibacterium sphagni TaxID=1786 RepID=UPI0013FDC133|nr:hypothetical protein [Mycolicibacterium sphagni]MCV7178700.1 hypothetical protein [Mycolicibacterium sphagni]